MCVSFNVRSTVFLDKQIAMSDFEHRSVARNCHLLRCNLDLTPSVESVISFQFTSNLQPFCPFDSDNMRDTNTQHDGPPSILNSA